MTHQLSVPEDGVEPDRCIAGAHRCRLGATGRGIDGRNAAGSRLTAGDGRSTRRGVWQRMRALAPGLACVDEMTKRGGDHVIATLFGEPHPRCGLQTGRRYRNRGLRAPALRESTRQCSRPFRYPAPISALFPPTISATSVPSRNLVRCVQRVPASGYSEKEWVADRATVSNGGASIQALAHVSLHILHRPKKNLAKSLSGIA